MKSAFLGMLLAYHIPPAFASQIIMEKHSYTDKAPILRCAVNTRLFRIKRQLLMALMSNPSSGNIAEST